MTGPVPEPPALRLPDGFAVRLDPRTRRRDGGTALLGGSPLRLLRLAPRAAALLPGDRLVVADPVTAALAARLLDAGVAHPDLAPSGGPAVTVVVPVRNRPAALARLLAALRADPGTAALPVVVVDDGSARPVTAPAGVRVLRHATSAGPAAARNTGLAAATTDLVAFLDSDCVPRPGWLHRLLPQFADPRLAAVAPRIVPLAGAARGWVSPYEDVAGALDMGPRPAAVRPMSAVSYVPSAALLVRRAAVGDGFDPAMRVAEDVDLVWRLAGAGWRVRYEPAAEVAHEHPAALGDWLRRRAFYGTGAALLAARHGSAVAPVVLAPETAATWGLALLGGRPGRLAAVGLAAATGVRLARRLRRPGEPLPLALAGGLAVRGLGASGQSLARAVTRHHWPLAVAASVVSGRARQVLAAVAVGEGLLAWWPHRRKTGPVRHVAVRRLDDLAYGAGLWAGAVRARDPRALLPARPPTA
ncbi:mycofactocin biosynthesis glycosyltransferase MftF [Blastococcus sp. TF02A-35]|uniref:mycofactocin biosynthesis glycosyltransferase MftF n=1 Tax=Blastococcus sp. TF02A-35 TaxID=2559612 RepID=UPI0010743A8A|nr:mycofactocin biosynthesis glycosyltransferase MftF [Blastococcus sp. TF02A_35]TFV48993.1 mycofactocin system glycosyltransferase [Blastococcus sp. TF02A_35]